jgi:exosortase E/protease (VPEID-CTERM system)
LAARLALLGLVFLAEKLLLDGLVDAERARAAQGFGAIVRLAQHWGFRFLVAFFAAVAAFAYVRAEHQLSSFATTVRATSIRIGWIFVHALLLAAIVPLSYMLYREGAAPLLFAVTALIWILLGAAAVAAAALAMAPWSVWLAGIRVLGVIWVYAAIAALLGTSAWHWSEKLWQPAAALTFDLVQRVLVPILPTMSADAATHVLRTDRFAVEITEVCSGLEGMGLMLVFSTAWLLYFRREYIFPRSLLLVPTGLAAIFALNVLRISVLMLIGHAGFPDIASSGFHSQAGWIAFNTVACGLVFLSRRSTWLNRTAAASAGSGATHNPTAIYLMPLLAILAAGALSRAMSGVFEFFYPLRLIVGLAVLARYRHELASIDWRWSWRGPAVGVVIFVIWIVCAHFLLPAAAIPEKLASLSPAWRGTWIASRAMAAVVTVPIAEELAYRGFLMRRLGNAHFEAVPFRSVGWLALTVTALIFGLAHGALWLPGIVAGMAFGLIVVKRGSLGEAVAAHVTTNALVAAGVLGAGQWQLW